MGFPHLREARPGDAEAIARILGDAIRSHAWFPVIHSRADDLAFIAGSVIPQQTVIVAEAAGRVAGFIATHDTWIDHLYVDPALTGRGIGSALLRNALRSMPSAQLWCFQQNTGARRFYERHGFVPVEFTDGSRNEEKLPDIRYSYGAGRP